MRPTYFFLIIILLCGCKKKSTEDRYVIELERFDICLNADYRDSIKCRQTTIGINKALEYAKSKGYKLIKFPKGLYGIHSEWGLSYTEVPTGHPSILLGIVIPSDLTLDLTEATFRIWPNTRIIYSIFLIHNAKNVTIKGGHLIGDRYEHTFFPYSDKPGYNTHEWGFGFNISNSQNISIDGATIEQMTGDGVILNGYDLSLKMNENIKIKNCKIFDCRRQGISHISGIHCDFSYNAIYQINGTAPASGIDIEVESKYGLIGKNIDIHHNTIYDCLGDAIVCHTGDSINIFNNTVYRNISIFYSQHVKIYNNIFHQCIPNIHSENKTVTLWNNTIIN